MPEKKVDYFRIYSLVREKETKLQRVTSPTRHRFNQILGGGLVRVVRKRPTTVTRSMLERLLPEVKLKEAAGILMVTDMVGNRIDLNTMAPTKKALAPNMTPNFPLDDAARDQTYPQGVGNALPNIPGGKALTTDAEVPVLLSPDIPEGVEDSGEDEGTPIEDFQVEVSPVAATPPPPAPSPEPEPVVVAPEPEPVPAPEPAPAEPPVPALVLSRKQKKKQQRGG